MNIKVSGCQFLKCLVNKLSHIFAVFGEMKRRTLCSFYLQLKFLDLGVLFPQKQKARFYKIFLSEVFSIEIM